MATQETLNKSMDRLVRPTVHIRGRALPTFQVCGVTGLGLAILLAMVLVVSRGLSPWVMAAIVGSAVATFFALAFASKIVGGQEQLVYYHHEIAVLTVAALLLWTLGQPVLAYLDATILGIGMFLACGRIGCFMVGCCHGRPGRLGVCYGHDHAQTGFPGYFVGVRLFPTQLVEALLALTVVVVGSALVLRGQPPGAALAWYIVAYDAGRFCLEFQRGDGGRPYYQGFSEAQWISLLLTWLVVAAGLLGVLPAAPWHGVVVVALTALLLGVAAKRRVQNDGRFQLLRADHMEEVARALGSGSSSSTAVSRTSQGIQVSSDRLQTEAGVLAHVALSRADGLLSDQEAATLAGLVLQLLPQAGEAQLIRGEQGVMHLLAVPTRI